MVKVYIDAGHGGSDPGATGNGIKEKDITLKIASKVRSYLLNDYKGIKVKMTRITDTFYSLKKRTDTANKWGADLFLSIHINAGGGKGFESFRYTGIAATSKTGQIQKYIHNAVNEVNGLTNRGMKTADLHVCRESKMPAVLTENGFIDSSSDAQKMKDGKWIDKVAQAHADGIAQAFGLKKKKKKKSPKQDKNLYRVQVGAFADKKNAEKLAKELHKKGYKTYITD